LEDGENRRLGLPGLLPEVLATEVDREHIRQAGTAENLAAAWAAAAIEYDAFVGRARLKAVKQNTIRQGIRAEMELARQAAYLAEAGRWNDALIAAERLQYSAWRGLIGMIRQAQSGMSKLGLR
jgi:hypothetical protein